VTRDESALNAALQATSAPATTGATTSATPSAAAAALGAFPTAGASEARTVAFSSTGGSSKSVVATPQQLAVDQAAIDVAQAQLTDAQQALDGVNLVSTIAGTVASVTIAAGDSVSAGASSNAAEVVVIGPGSSYQLVAQVPVADIVKVAVGQPATVTPDATNDQLEGRVISIGTLPTSGSTSTTYPVTIALNSSDLGLFSGADAAAAIVIGRAADVIAVPTSAVRTVGSVHLVTVVTNGTTKTTRVTLGTVGDVLTQITSGVKPGQVVALANLQAPVPTTSTAITRFGGTGLGGGGLGRIGFGAGGGGRFGSGGLGG
jgi:trimeric autotransporter adhesin